MVIGASNPAARCAVTHDDARRQGADHRMTTEAFLDSIGINIHIDQGYDEASYVEPILFMGIREVRDSIHHLDRALDLHARTGVRFAIDAGGDLDGLLSAARTLARDHALLALEGPNEANNFPIQYKGDKGGGTASWTPVARFQRDLYAAVRHDPLLSSYPVFGPSEVGAEMQDVGLQFLTIPASATSLFAAGTRFSDDANVHNYVSGTTHSYDDNQAWNAADPTLSSHWDGLFANHGLTWRGRYRGYTDAALATLPRVSTETGWDTISNPGGERVQGVVLTNTYLAQYKRGWAYTFVYELRDGEGSEGHQGLYAGAAPKLAATYLHNLTTILSAGHGRSAGRRLDYSIANEPGTVHDMLLAKKDGRRDLVIWDERASGQDRIAVTLSTRAGRVDLYDVTVGTRAIQSLERPRSIPLTLSDHALVLEFSPRQ